MGLRCLHYDCQVAGVRKKVPFQDIPERFLFYLRNV